MLFAIILLLPLSITVKADQVPTIEQIDQAIFWFVKKAPRNPAYKPEYRKELAVGFYSAGFEFSLPPLLLTAKSFRESSFRTTAVGWKLGEIGLMQVTQFCVDICPEYCGNLETVQEQIDCGACCLKHNIDSCNNSLYYGLSKYACGRCKPKSNKIADIVNSRINLWHKLRRIVFNDIS